VAQQGGAPPARRSWPRAATYFADHGIDRIERVMTDNAWAYRWSLREVITALGARQKFIRPHCPWQNGKVERLNRTLTTEWAYRQAFTSNDERRCPCSVDRALQHSTPPQRSRPAPPDQPPGTNLMAGYTW
jgi:transposase InsO family protein